MAAVAFDLALFRASFPEFSGVSDATLPTYFDRAQLYLSNTDDPVSDEGKRLALYNLLVAHFAALAMRVAGNPTNGTGRVASASQGSVSVAYDYAVVPANAWFFGKTQYGEQFWQATVPYRSFRYSAPPKRVY